MVVSMSRKERLVAVTILILACVSSGQAQKSLQKTTACHDLLARLNGVKFDSPDHTCTTISSNGTCTDTDTAEPQMEQALARMEKVSAW